MVNTEKSDEFSKSYDTFDQETTHDADAENVEDVLQKIGFGRFHVVLFLIVTWTFSADAIEMVSLGFIITPIQCELELTSTQKGILSGIMFLGMVLGSSFWGPLSDSKGRRLLCIITTGIHGVASIIFSLSQDFWLCLAMRFMAGFGIGGTIPVLYAYFSEFLPRNVRGTAVSAMRFFWPVAGLLTSGLAYLVLPHSNYGIKSAHFVFNNWHIFAMLCGIPSLSSSLLFLCLPKSPKYLLQMNMHEEAVHVLNKIAIQNRIIKHNEKICVKVFLEKLPDDPNQVTGILGTLRQMLETTKLLFSKRWRVLAAAYLFGRFCVAYACNGLVIWIPELMKRMELTGISTCAQSISFNFSTVESNIEELCNLNAMADKTPYSDTAIIYVASIPLGLVATFLVDRIGRKSIMIFNFIVGGMFVVTIAFVYSRWQVLLLGSIMMGLIMNAFSALTVIGTEIAPTQLRSTLLSFGNVASKIASVVANMVFSVLIDISCLAPLLTSGILLIFGGVCGFLLPDLTKMNIN